MRSQCLHRPDPTRSRSRTDRHRRRECSKTRRRRRASRCRRSSHRRWDGRTREYRCLGRSWSHRPDKSRRQTDRRPVFPRCKSRRSSSTRRSVQHTAPSWRAAPENPRSRLCRRRRCRRDMGGALELEVPLEAEGEVGVVLDEEDSRAHAAPVARVAMTRAPPSGASSRRTPPPWRSARSRTTASPIPVPVIAAPW